MIQTILLGENKVSCFAHDLIGPIAGDPLCAQIPACDLPLEVHGEYTIFSRVLDDQTAECLALPRLCLFLFELIDVAAGKLPAICFATVVDSLTDYDLEE